MSRVREQLHEAATGGGDANLSGEERDVAAHYEQQLGELCSCLRQLRGQWEQYLENLDQRHVFTAYQAQVVPASGRGIVSIIVGIAVIVAFIVLIIALVILFCFLKACSSNSDGHVRY